MEPEILDALRRDSGIRLDAAGQFHYRASTVQHPRVQALFHRGLSVREDAEVVLTVGRRWCYVSCEGVARFVEGIRVAGDRIVLRLRGRGEVRSEGARFGYGPDDRLYVWLPGVRGPALLTRAAHQALLARVDDAGEIEWGAGARRPLVMLEHVPGPGDAPPEE